LTPYRPENRGGRGGEGLAPLLSGRGGGGVPYSLVEEETLKKRTGDGHPTWERGEETSFPASAREEIKRQSALSRRKSKGKMAGRGTAGRGYGEWERGGTFAVFRDPEKKKDRIPSTACGEKSKGKRGHGVPTFRAEREKKKGGGLLDISTMTRRRGEVEGS